VIVLAHLAAVIVGQFCKMGFGENSQGVHQIRLTHPSCRMLPCRPLICLSPMSSKASRSRPSWSPAAAYRTLEDRRRKYPDYPVHPSAFEAADPLAPAVRLQHGRADDDRFDITGGHQLQA